MSVCSLATVAPSPASLKNLRCSLASFNILMDKPLLTCPMGCGRSFIEESLRVHMKVCKEVFQQKRMQFNTKVKRLGIYNIKDKPELLTSPRQGQEKLKTEVPNCTKIVKNPLPQPQKICSSCKKMIDSDKFPVHIGKCRLKIKA